MQNANCSPEGCIDTVCVPDTAQCIGDTAYQVCAPDGMAWDEHDCPQQHYCDSGNCHPWVCEPGAAFCEGNIAKVCSNKGDAVTSQTNCGEKTCQEGQCKNCQPQCEGKVCGEDGCGGTCGSCPPGQPCKNGKCPTPCELLQESSSSLGCTFWAVDLDNVEAAEFMPVGLVVSAPLQSPGPAVLTVLDYSVSPPAALSAQTLKVDSLTVPPGQSRTLVLPPRELNGSILVSRSFSLTSTLPVAVSQFNPLSASNSFSNDASLLLPLHLLGNEHFALSWPHRTNDFTMRGFVAVVAAENGTTTVQVWPTAQIATGLGVPDSVPPPGEPLVFLLNQGEVLNLETKGPEGEDLTGSRFNSDKKVAVFGGHECANIPTLSTNYCDHIEHQLLPTNLWGQTCIGDVFKLRGPQGEDTFRVISAQDNVQITTTPNVAGPAFLNKGAWMEFSTGQDFHLTATGPVLLGHYAQSSNYSGYVAECDSTTGIGDPSLAISLPLALLGSHVAVVTPAGFKEDYLSIVFQSGNQQTVTVDGTPLSQWVDAETVAIGGTDWSVARLPVNDGPHTVKSDGAPVGVKSYGYDCDVSYACSGGFGSGL